MSTPPATEYQEGSALSLSGGGYRALLFHLGGMWRLNELGLLRTLRCVVGVSGGALAGAWLGLKWRELRFSTDGAAENFSALVAEPLMQLATRPLDIAAGLIGLITPHSPLPQAYRPLFGDARLSDLPEGNGDGPKICLLATNLLCGSYAEFWAGGIRDSRLGEIAYPQLPLCTAAGASCSLPPTFKPVCIRVRPEQWTAAGDPALEPLRRVAVPLRLVDGGNYDNLGLAAAWDKYRLLLVSDGSSPMPPWRWISSDWITATLRSNRILIDQARQLRKHELIRRRFTDPHWPQQGAYWGIAGQIDEVAFAPPLGQAPALCHDSETTHGLARMRTRLGRHTAREIAQLVNWGYAMADATLRKYVAAQAPAPAWPLPDYPL
jgi:NTE family protein